MRDHGIPKKIHTFNYGYSCIFLAVTITFEIIAISAYSVAEKCSTEAFWTTIIGSSVSKVTSLGGASTGFEALSIITFFIGVGALLYITFTQSELPHGPAKEPPVKFLFTSPDAKKEKKNQY